MLLHYVNVALVVYTLRTLSSFAFFQKATADEGRGVVIYNAYSNTLFAEVWSEMGVMIATVFVILNNNIKTLFP